MGELEQQSALVTAAILQRVSLSEFHPCKVSIWIKLVRPVMVDGAQMEETVGGVHKVMLTANSYEELVRQVADNLLLTVFGGDVQIVKDMPNLIIKLFEQKAYVPMAGAPPIDQAGQLFLKATVYRWEPSLWDQLFNRRMPAP